MLITFFCLFAICLAHGGELTVKGLLAWSVQPPVNTGTSKWNKIGIRINGSNYISWEGLTRVMDR